MGTQGGGRDPTAAEVPAIQSLVSGVRLMSFHLYHRLN